MTTNVPPLICGNTPAFYIEIRMTTLQIKVNEEGEILEVPLVDLGTAAQSLLSYGRLETGVAGRKIDSIQHEV